MLFRTTLQQFKVTDADWQSWLLAAWASGVMLDVSYSDMTNRPFILLCPTCGSQTSQAHNPIPCSSAIFGMTWTFQFQHTGSIKVAGIGHYHQSLGVSSYHQHITITLHIAETYSFNAILTVIVWNNVMFIIFSESSLKSHLIMPDLENVHLSLWLMKWRMVVWPQGKMWQPSY